MRTALIAYIAMVIVFTGTDFIWLSLTHNAIYQARLGSLLLDKPNMVAAIVFYLLYAVGIVAFAVLPAVHQESWVRALWAGALFGFLAYATYDMTNMATLKGWSSFVSAVDMSWGTVATGIAATAGYFITRAL